MGSAESRSICFRVCGAKVHAPSLIDMEGRQLNAIKSPAYANADNLWVAALLIDADSKEIVQAAKAPVTVTAGIVSVAADKPSSMCKYDLMGRMISHPLPGQIYIQNGKKHIDF